MTLPEELREAVYKVAAGGKPEVLLAALADHLDRQGLSANEIAAEIIVMDDATLNKADGYKRKAEAYEDSAKIVRNSMYQLMRAIDPAEGQ